MAEDTSLVTFASLDDLEEWTGKEYEGDDATRAKALLEDASVALVGFGFDPTETDPYRLHLAKQCVCNAVSYKLSRDAAYESASQVSESAGPYSKTFTYVTPSGSLTFLRQDLALLGLGTSHYRSVGASTADLSPRDWGTTW